MINFASEHFEIDKPMCIEQCKQMNRIVHNLRGINPSNERTLSHIIFINSFIRQICVFRLRNENLFLTLIGGLLKSYIFP